ncbi:MAG: hypothetical protein Q6J33_06840 [Gloeomargarita sp. DG_2_bins_126]
MAKSPHLYVAISGHGLGHITRSLAVVQELRLLQPDLRLTMATPAPASVLQSYLDVPFTYRPVKLDVGVVQKDSLLQDLAATQLALQALEKQREHRVTEEVNYIRRTGVNLIFADIPAMAGFIAHRAQIPCVMASNFSWDWIYRDWGGVFIELAAQYSEGYRYCGRLFRLPFAEPMAVFPNQIDVGLTGQNPRFAPALIRQTLAIDTPPERTVLLAFGGLGLQGIPYRDLARFPDWCFLSYDRHAPPLPNLRLCHATPYRPVDVMPLCAKVVTKPGYSTYSEAYRLGVPIYSLERRGFAEADLLLAGLQQYCYHRVIAVADFYAQPWAFLRLEPLPPQSAQGLATDGNATIAAALQADLAP